MKLSAVLFCALLNVFIQPVVAQSEKGYDAKASQPEPKLFAEGTISAGDYESHPAFSLTGDTLIFVKSGPDLSKWTLCISYFRKNTWTTPEVAPFSGQYMDADPFFTKDGRTLFFISNRPLKEGDAAKDFDIWKIAITKNGWGKPLRLDAPVNSASNEYYPTLADNGTIYFGSRRNEGQGASDIYRSELVDGKYAIAQNVGETINTTGSEYEPFISPDEKFLIFMAARPDHLDNADLYISHHQNNAWTIAEKLPEPFNSSVTEFSPKITRDGKYFFFASTRNRNPSTSANRETMKEVNQRIHSAGNGLGDIYYVDLSALKIKK
jgi:Tol biopolymer transport system component